jgi:hypothetical protein
MKFLKNKKKINTQRLFCYMPFFLLALLFPKISLAQTFFGDSIANGFLIFFNFILNFILSLVTYVFAASRWLLDLMLDPLVYEKVFFSSVAIEAIKSTWGVVRDFFNMFFMLIILLVAIGTILRINKFSDKKIILNVVLAALLINFSLPIAMVFIDISQLAMTFFMEGVSQDGLSFTGRVSDGIDLGKIFSGKFSDNLGYFINLIFAIIFLLVMSMMISVLAVSLLIRIISYWVLLILSPMAMFGIALKGTGLGAEKMTSYWFEKMSFYSFFGPVLTFFLWIALHLINVTSELTLNSQYFNSAFDVSSYSETKLGTMGQISVSALGILVPFVVTVYLLFYGYDLSKKMSSGAVGNLMNWGSKKMNTWGKTWGRRAAIGTAAVGTLGAAPAAYYGYKNQLQPRISGAAAGFRDKDRAWYNPLGWTKTSSKQEAARKERQTAWEAKAEGQEAYNKYERVKVNEQLKKWDELGVPGAGELKEKMEKGDNVERKAAAMRLSKDGKLETKEDFEKAMSAIGIGKKKDNILEARIRDNAKAKNIHAIMEYDISKAMTAIKTGDHNKILKEAKQNALMKKELELEEEKRKAMPRSDGTPYTPMSDTEKADYLASIANDFKEKAYKNKIDEMGIKDIQNQNPEFFSVKEAVTAIKQKLETSPTLQDEFNKAAARNTSTSKQALLRQKGLLG